MLSEKIEKYSDIADRDGILFVWKSMVSGVTSIESLSNLRFHYAGKINVNVDLTLELFQTLELLEFNGDQIKFTISFLEEKINNDNDFILFFTKLLLNFLLENEYIDRSKIIFDITENSFVLLRNSIKYKYASVRNLLLSLFVIKKRFDGSYILDDYYLPLLQNNTEEKLKLDEKKLLEILELQRCNGELGEVFVLEYEIRRLSSHKTINNIKRISNIDVAAGYDIISYNNCFSERIDRFIEVKTYSGKPHFYWSKNEISVARLKSKNYFLYLVDLNKIYNSDYEPEIISDPTTHFENCDKWLISAQTYLYELL